MKIIDERERKKYRAKTKSNKGGQKFSESVIATWFWCTIK